MLCKAKYGLKYSGAFYVTGNIFEVKSEDADALVVMGAVEKLDVKRPAKYVGDYDNVPEEKVPETDGTETPTRRKGK